MDVIDDQIDVVGRAMLGMTIACARCHDHKFDPIPTADYYAMAGIFRSTQTMAGVEAGKKAAVDTRLISLADAPGAIKPSAEEQRSREVAPAGDREARSADRADSQNRAAGGQGRAATQRER